MKTFVYAFLLLSVLTRYESEESSCDSNESSEYYSDDDRYSHGHDSHDHHGKGKVYAANGDNWSSNDKTNTSANAYSIGKGSSASKSGPGGSNASSKGTLGSGSQTTYKHDGSSARNQWSSYKDSKGRR